MVGRSYDPKFYDYIKNTKVRKVFYKIAEETEEDYQKLINLLKSFNVEIIRPEVSDNYKDYAQAPLIPPPPMAPRDHCAVIGNDFYINAVDVNKIWNDIKGANWPDCPENFNDIASWILEESRTMYDLIWTKADFSYYNIIKYMKQHSNVIMNKGISAAMTTRVGKDLYFGTVYEGHDISELKESVHPMFPNYRCHVIETYGHADSSFCPVVPGLIVSLVDMPTYEKTFPGWEVISLPHHGWNAVKPFLELKKKNKGKWWVPGEELNDDFTNFVETWMNHWVGYVEETVFDINILVIDEKNIVCNNYNKEVFDAFDRYGITAHVINFRHRYFWDGGLHCITSDLHREGVLQDYFPERG